MAKGLIKYVMLKTISDREVTGYQLIKKVESITGHKPSTGTIYPMLKSMERDGWVKGMTKQHKTYYQITRKGKNQLQELESLKTDHMMKIHQNISLAGETFHDIGPLMMAIHNEVMEAMEPLIMKIGEMLHNGNDIEEISKIIDRIIREIEEGEKK